MRLVWSTVTGVAPSDVPGAGQSAGAQDAQRLDVVVDEPAGATGRAVCFPALTGPCRLGDRVLLNTTAVDLGLGTGGLHFVVARADPGAPPSGTSLDVPGPGRIMKLRYTPMQLDVAAVEEHGSPGHEALRTAESLEGMPVVCCGLHSQVPLVAAGVRSIAPDARIAYVMTDEAALPMALSELAARARRAGLLDVTLTAGQAFGGELESVNLHSGLLAARSVAGADLAIVGIGPGVVGTATPFGHGGVAQGEALNAVASLGGASVATLRLSFADQRPRHRPVSHHSLIALTRVALAPARVAVPRLPDAGHMAAVDEALALGGVWRRHARVDEEAEPSLARDAFGLEVTTMGRTVEDDPAFFAASICAGRVAARLL